MSAEITPTSDPDRATSYRALAFLAIVVVLLVLLTYFLGFGALLMVSIAGSFIMLGILIYLSSPTHKV